MSTFSANGINLADSARLAGESMEEWLRGFEGYAGLLILTNEDESRARVMTFWTSREALSPALAVARPSATRLPSGSASRSRASSPTRSVAGPTSRSTSRKEHELRLALAAQQLEVDLDAAQPA